MRGKRAKKREISPDAKYKNVDIAKFINYVMKDGKKTTAAEIVYASLDELAKKLKGDPVELFDLALRNIKPPIEIRAKRLGGANYQVPVPVTPERQTVLAMRWILESARGKRGGRPFYEALTQELVAATKKEGDAYKKKEDTIKMAEANKAFAHLA